MEMNLRVDTSVPQDLQHLAVIGNAFNGNTVALPAPAANAAPAADKPKKLTATTNTAAPTGGTTVTLEQLKALASTKKTEECKVAIAKVHPDEPALSKVPAEKYAELLELFQKCANK